MGSRFSIVKVNGPELAAAREEATGTLAGDPLDSLSATLLQGPVTGANAVIV
jgi:hypothetical protein